MQITGNLNLHPTSLCVNSPSGNKTAYVSNFSNPYANDNKSTFYLWITYRWGQYMKEKTYGHLWVTRYIGLGVENAWSGTQLSSRFHQTYATPYDSTIGLGYACAFMLATTARESKAMFTGTNNNNRAECPCLLGQMHRVLCIGGH